MMRKSLSQLLVGQPSLPIIHGIVDIVLRNDDGSIAEHVHKRNMITDAFRPQFVYNNRTLNTKYVFINENSEPMHPKRTAMRTVLPGTFVMSTTASMNGANRLWTYSVVFAVPPSNRTFQTVGLTETVDTGGYTGVRAGPSNIIAATVLGAPITQLTTQTLEVAYRLAFQRT